MEVNKFIGLSNEKNSLNFLSAFDGQDYGRRTTEQFGASGGDGICNQQ